MKLNGSVHTMRVYLHMKLNGSVHAMRVYNVNVLWLSPYET